MHFALRLLLLSLTLLGCSHQPLNRSKLERVAHPAWVARFSRGAGPRVDAPGARGDFKDALRRTMTRFEIGDGLRANTASLLAGQQPWDAAVDPARVASTLETFLVQEDNPDTPDYAMLQRLGADAVVEIVVERFGVAGTADRAGAYLEGYGRMFLVDGGTLWKRSFSARQGEGEGLPVAVLAHDPEQYREQMRSLVRGVAELFAADLSAAP